MPECHPTPRAMFHETLTNITELFRQVLATVLELSARGVNSLMLKIMDMSSASLRASCSPFGGSSVDIAMPTVMAVTCDFATPCIGSLRVPKYRPKREQVTERKLLYPDKLSSQELALLRDGGSWKSRFRPSRKLDTLQIAENLKAFSSNQSPRMTIAVCYILNLDKGNALWFLNVHVLQGDSSGSRKASGISGASGCRCLGEGAWFEFSSESSSRNAKTSRVGDFKIISHLQQLGCGDLTKKPQEVYFPGCMNESYAFYCTGGDYFVKINRRFDVDSMFVGELEALKMMKATNTIRVPTPLGFGSLSDGGSYLIMEHLHFRPFGMLQNTCQEALGRSMAQLHLADVGLSFGFPVQTRLGVLELCNSWSTSWAEFFIEKRLRERLERVYAIFGKQEPDILKKGNLVLEHATSLFKDYHARPSLLHGDLWMGNSGLLSSGEVAIYDPASFIGDSEFELAFQGWSPSKGFPGLLEGFYRSYHALLPRASGFDERHQVYQLYHLLNHLLLYRVEYFQHVMVAMDKILKG